jgi:hypothetical protein
MFTSRRRSSKRRLLGSLAISGGAAVMITACSIPAISTTTTEVQQLPIGNQGVDLNPNDFTTDIDNHFWPMKPGTRWTYRDIDTAGTEQSVTVVVTDLTKTIANGITARVVRDTVREGGTIIEDTFDWYAQDAQGAIWYLGEDTAEFEDGAVASRHGSFEAGVDGALPGILIPGNPRPGQKYRQEYYAGQAEDNGEILSVREKVQVPYGAFEGVLMTADTSGIEPNVLEHKFYAQGVGQVLSLDISGGSGREELISVDTVPPGTGTGPLGHPE